jgi:hypothetical protein
MSGRVGGLIPLLIRKKTLFPALKTLTEIGLFYTGLVLLRSRWLSVWELLVLGLATGNICALLFCRYRFSQEQQVLWNLAKRAFFLPSGVGFIVGWYLWRYWYLPEILLKAGLIPFIVSFLLFLDYLEREFHSQMVVVAQREEIISFFHRGAFLLFPLTLSVIFNYFNLL